MNIIVISDLWTGMRPVLFNAQLNASGMPAFFNMFKRLCADERIENLDFYFIGKGPRVEKNVCYDFSQKANVNVFFYESKLSFAFQYLRIFFAVIAKLIFSPKGKNKLYGHGAAGALTGIISMITRTPNIRRLYGTFLINYLNNSKFSIFSKHPLAYLAFSLPHEYLIVTNDGTHGDVVYKKINGESTDKLGFWVNGVDALSSIENNHNLSFSKSNIITYIARIDPWKQQHLAIEAFSRSSALREGYKLKIIGPTFDRDYECKLKSLISLNNLDGVVELVGSLDREKSELYMKSSILTCSFYDTSNFGNVFIEALLMGIPVVSHNINGSLDIIPKNCYFELGNYEVENIATNLEEILKNIEKLHAVSKAAVDFSKTYFLSWQDRIAKELDVLIR